MESIEITPIGAVSNGENDSTRVDWSAVESVITLDGLGDALLGLDGYSHVIVVGWLDQIPEQLRSRRQSYPAGDESLPLQGALALRGPRPNPFSVTVCALLAVEGDALRVRGLTVRSGRFGAHMLVESENDGPVTILLDSLDHERPRRG